MASTVLAACGGVSSKDVADVDGNQISRTYFAHWLTIAAATSQGDVPEKVSYVPPGYATCIASKRKSTPKPAKGQPVPTDAQFKSQCESEYKGLRDQVMQFLILEKWVGGEAGEQGVKVTDKEAKTAYDAAVKQSFPKASDFNDYLKQSGMTVGDAQFQVRFNTLYTKLRERAVKNAKKVTDASVKDFYDKNKDKPPITRPETRDLRVVLAKTEADAKAAKAALEAGGSWKTIAKKYSVDPASKDQGGTLLGIAKGTQPEKTFDNAVFSAPKAKITGPVKTQFGYYVFSVQRIVAAATQSLKDATPTIKQQLDATNKQKADDDFNLGLRKKWKARTACADDYKMSQCKNYEAPKTTATAAPAQPPAG